ncbi:DNA polymerase theta [Ischnura elegans]|uniref:DNA polymerase theta n=1 Tax=Ischnura elegans TaxID=197161 RepID=UPI001ED88603|nr:DNA polymerase theta [Ischnura elegans]
MRRQWSPRIMEEDFPSVVFGDNTLAAIEDAEKNEKSHQVPLRERNSRVFCKFSGTNNNSNGIRATESLSDVSSKCCGDGVASDIIKSENQNVSLCELSAYLEKCADNVISGSDGVGRRVTKPNKHTVVPKVGNYSLRDCGLPPLILKKYDEMGIKSMFQWQYECVTNVAVLSGKNLIYSAPTSAGKTLVAEILTVRSVFKQQKKAIIILPFVSVVKEKTSYFQELMEGTGIRVEGFMGGYSPAGGFQQTDVAVCTIEKANSLIIRLMEDGNLGALGIVVVDELHLLGDPHRGYLLELLLTKIRYMCLRDKIKIQIVGMSATLPNLELLASWLQADLYQTSFRPVPLRELIKLGKTIYDNEMKEICRVDCGLSIKGDADDVTFLCLETIAQGFSVLIFCPTKNWCEKLAETVAKDFFFIGTSSLPVAEDGRKLVEKFIQQLNKSPLSEVIDKLKRSPAGLDPILAKTVSLGVAFHHAGLTMDERDILESSFRSGVLRVLVATSTLSSGVNLPARRVIVRTPIFHGKLVDILTYKQMIGRAGRMGVDTAGESILVCHEKEKGMVERLLNAELPAIQSCLGSGRSTKLSASLKRAVFEVVASGVASTPEQVECYTNLTLLAAIMKAEKKVDFQIHDPLKTCLKYLEECEFIRLEKSGENGEVKYVATHLGEACLAASLPPDQAMSLFEELQRARKCFVLEDELHIIYQVTPFSVADQWGDSLDWLHLLNMWECLPSSLKRVGELVGIDERFIVRAMRGSLNLRAPKQIEKMGIHRRFYTALALRELVNEVPINDVAQKYGCNRGMLQSLQQSAAIFAGMVTQFCRRLRWTGMELLASQLQDRLQFGIRGELCDLMRLPMLDGQCARALFDAGIESLAMLAAETSPAKVDQALRTFIPFQSGKTNEDEANGNGKKKKWISSMCSVRNLLEKNVAVYLIKEARKIIQKELGVADMKWCDDLEGSKDSIEGNTLSPAKQDELPLNVSKSLSVAVESPVLNFGNECVNDPNGSQVLVDTMIGGNPSVNDVLSLDEKPATEKINLNDNTLGAGITFTRPAISHNECKPVDGSKSSIYNSLNDSSEMTQFSALHLSHLGKNNSLSSGQASPVVISSSPMTNVVVNQSGRSSFSDFNGTKRTSLDIFSSPLVDEMPTANSSNQSPSLFGDSFTVDTQLENLINGSSGSNKAQPQVSALDKNQALLSCTSNGSSTPKLPNVNPPLIRNASSVHESGGANMPRSFQATNRLNFNKQSPIIAPQTKSIVIPETQDSSEPCPVGEIITPSKWDFGSMVEEDLFDETYCENDAGINALKSDVSKEEKKPDKGSCKDEEAMRAVCEVQTYSPSSKQELPSSLDVKIKGVCKTQSVVSVREDILCHQLVHRVDPNSLNSREKNEDKREDVHQATNKDKRDEIKQAIVGIDSDFRGKRLSIEAVSSSFLEKAFTSAFDFEDELTMRVESSSRKTKGKSEQELRMLIGETESQGEHIEESDEDVWGSHVQNISLEAVHHSIACPSSSEEDDERETMIISSQVFSTSKVGKVGSLNNLGCLSRTGRDSSFVKFERQLEKSVKSDDICDGVNKVNAFRSCSVPKHVSRNTFVPATLKRDCAVGPDFHIVDVCENVDIFRNFCDKFEHLSRFSFSVALSESYCDDDSCDKLDCDEFINVSVKAEKSKVFGKRKRMDADGEFEPFYFLGVRSLMDGNTAISGISFSWEDEADCVFFMPLNLNKAAGSDAMGPSEDEKMLFLKKTFKTKKSRSGTCIAMHLREHLRTLFVTCGVNIASKANFWDPKVADWLLNPDGKEKNLRSLCIAYCPGVWTLIESCGYSPACRGCWSLGMDTRSPLPPHVRSSIEALVALKAMTTLERMLTEQNLFSIFSDYEMQATCCLIEIEAFGIGFSESQGIHMKTVLASKMRELEKKACSLAGHSFRLSSPKEVGKVLYQELKLPWKDPKVSSSFKGKKKWSTSKETLERLTSVHQLPKIIIEWRKMSSILSKTVLPLLRFCQRNRIHGSHITHTSTGRISMHEPNLQSIPRDFELSSLSPDSARGYIIEDERSSEEVQSKEGNSLSIRHCFYPRKGFVYLSADYSQLELRLIAHMSKDQKLCAILNKGCDVFCQIASIWKNIDAAQVSPNLRQQAKGICYGMLYGIGSKSLGEQLGVDESDASNFMESFKNAFPGLKAFLISSVQKCRSDGFVETMGGRKRELPSIRSTNPGQRAHAERQAVNTIVQGSAADLVKAAMVKIDQKLHSKNLSLSSRVAENITSSDFVAKRPRKNRSNLNNNSLCNSASGAFLVLHLHDELLYEVSMDTLERVAQIVKSEMEAIWKLEVKLPVNLKVGKSWGALMKYETSM